MPSPSTIDRIIEAIQHENDLQLVANSVSLPNSYLKTILLKALRLLANEHEESNNLQDLAVSGGEGSYVAQDKTAFSDETESDSSDTEECEKSKDARSHDRLSDERSSNNDGANDEISLSDEQKEFVRLVVEQNRNLALLCPAGYGKTTVITSLISSLRRTRKPRSAAWFQQRYGNYCNVDRLQECPVFGLCASTGKAASLIKGRTLHSFLGIGIGRGSVSDWVARVSTAKYMRQTFDALRAMQVLIIDEISMISAQLLDKISDYLQQVRKCTDPFGGVQLVLVGDLCQLAPVQGEFMFMSKEYKAANVEIFKLTKCFRQSDPTFLALLNELRYGKCSEQSMQTLRERTQIDETYARGMAPMKLLSTNNEVDEVNEYELMRSCKQSGEKINIFKVRAVTGSALNRKAELYRKLDGIPEEVKLAVGCQVVITHNLGGAVVNGSQGRVVSISSTNEIQVELLDGIVTTVRYIGYKDPEHPDIYKAPSLFSYLPMRLGYASTIHKAQGMTLKLLEVDLKRVFAHGQGYVAISRCVDLRGLIVRNLLSVKAFICDRKVKAFYGVVS